jgi:ribonuclease BN (tRNA processing enzyme)
MSGFDGVVTPRNDSPAAAERVHPCAAHPGHIVQFYEDKEFLFDSVTRFLRAGVSAGQPLVVFATGEHLDAFAARLGRNGYDVDDGCRNGQLTLMNAREALSSFMVDAMPDDERFRSSVGTTIEKVHRIGNGNGVRAYGEMVDVLWRDGNHAAAIRLEELWNELARTHSFTLLCAYAMGNFYKEAHADAFQQICRGHDRVIPAESYAGAATEESRGREIARLQQRARALESEIEHRRVLEQALRRALTDRRRAEEELKRAKDQAERASRAKSDFLAVMSHELRTPLNAIMGYRDLLAQEVGGPITPAQKSYVDRIQRGAEQLLGLIDQVLSLSRIEAVFISHFHGDHFFGLMGLLSTMALLNRKNPLEIVAPVGIERMMECLPGVRKQDLPFALHYREIGPEVDGEVVYADSRCTVEAGPLSHRIFVLGFRYEARPKPGKVDAERARELGVEPMQIGRLVRGESIVTPAGRTGEPHEVGGPPRRGVCVTYCGDTVPCENSVRLGREVDLLIHEATFADEEAG